MKIIGTVLIGRRLMDLDVGDAGELLVSSRWVSEACLG